MLTNHVIELPNCNLTVEIQYEVEPSEYGKIEGTNLTCRIPGQLLIEDVEVLEIEGFNQDGDDVYYRDYRDLERLGWLKVLDDIAYNFVMEELDHGLNYILWERA